MNALKFLVIFITSLNIAHASSYAEEVKEALGQLQEAKKLITESTPNSIPNFEANPQEASHLPSEMGELEQKGKAFIAQNQEAQFLEKLASNSKGQSLNENDKDQARRDLESTLSEEIACQDGRCIPVASQESQDFAEGAVQMGALNGVAEETRASQSRESMAAIFKGQNITCRVVSKTNRINYCNSKNDNFGASQAERALHKAQREGRALLAHSNAYCSKKIAKICREKRKSWCVFQSKLAKIIQIESRKQLNLSFGSVGGDSNHADCRGLRPNEMALISFDTPSMQQALREVTKEFESKKHLPNPAQTSRQISDKAKFQIGDGYDWP